jgi:RNA polymerase sigma-70 factor (ECF subfamily)
MGPADISQSQPPDGLQQLPQLFSNHQGPLHDHVLRILRDRAETDDIVQDTFERLIRQLRSGVAIANVRAWLFTVGRNLATDQIRRRTHYTRLDHLEADRVGGEADPAPNAEQCYLEAERAARVRRALKRLSPMEARCMELRSSGLLYREIGELLGVRISTVESALARAIQKILRETR